MRGKVSAQLQHITTTSLMVVVALLPLLFFSGTTEFYDTPKLILLLIAVLLLLILKSLTWVTSGKVLITRTPLDIPLALLLGITILSALFSQVKQIAFFGNLPRIDSSAVSWILYALFYLLITSHLKTQGQIKKLYYALLASATLVALVSLLSYFGVYLSFLGNFTRAANFTPTGSAFSASTLLALLLPLPLLSITTSNKFLSTKVGLLLSTLFLVVIVLIGNLATYAAAVCALILAVWVQRKAIAVLHKQHKLLDSLYPLLSVPVGITILVLLLTLLPIAGSLGSIHQKAVNFPRELQLPFVTSWKVGASAFRDAPFLGTGPSTYLFDFTAYKPIEYNSTNLWNIRFEDGFDAFLQVLPTLGGLGVLAFVFLAVTILVNGWKGLSENEENTLGLSLSISAILTVVILALHNNTLVGVTSMLTLFAMLMASNKSVAEKVEEFAIGIKTSKLTDSSLVTGDILPSILFIIIVLITLMVLFNPFGLNATRMVMADVHHRTALNAASTQGLLTYNELVKSEQLNPLVDLYRTDLAQTNFALANAIAAAKGPTSASPSGSLTDADKQNIQTLLSQSINEGKAAVILNPLSSQNWEILASIYRQISGVAQNAMDFSLAAYGQAIQRDPLNPLLRLNAGGVYYSIKNYQLAIRFFSDAANLKPDYANAYYNLAIALRDSGDTQNAIAATQQVLTLVDPKSADYQTAQKLLSDLQSAQKNGSNAQAGNTNQPPAAKETSALQQKNLPNVLNLPKGEQTATPAAVKK